MPPAGTFILILKIAVIAVTVLLVAAVVAVACGNYRLHGRLNLVSFVLTLAALLGLEVLARVVSPQMFNEYFTRTDSWTVLYCHLAFSVPAALILPVMLYTGLRHHRRAHLTLACVFATLWLGTLITGVFFLPHE